MVTGEPETEKPVGAESATEDTDPLPVPTGTPFTRTADALIVPLTSSL